MPADRLDALKVVEEEVAKAQTGSPCEDCLKELACRIRLIKEDNRMEATHSTSVCIRSGERIEAKYPQPNVCACKAFFLTSRRGFPGAPSDFDLDLERDTFGSLGPITRASMREEGINI